MLRRKEGATIAQIVEATGWQPHTVRGAFAGALKKKLGLTVTSEKVEGASGYTGSTDRTWLNAARAAVAHRGRRQRLPLTRLLPSSDSFSFWPLV